MMRLMLLVAGVALACCGPTRILAETSLDWPLREQIVALESGAMTCDELARAYQARIAARDGDLHAVLALDRRALASATSLDGQRGRGARLQGAVLLLKDNIDTAGLATTAGSLALASNVPVADARVVARLREAHALVLGKTNLSEWGNFRGYGSTSGWSSLGGQTYNGRAAGLSPCGSSSGSAAAVAAGLASAALGTETAGSIVCPASVNGVVGFKPTVGLVSRTGVIPISSSQDTVGPITRTVGDAARLLSVMAGADPGDPATQAIPAGLALDFEAGLAGATLQGKRLGVVDFGFEPDVQALFAAERARLVDAGATVVDVTLGEAAWEDELTVLLTEFKAGVNAYLAAHPVAGQPATLQELIAFNEAHASTVLVHHGQELFILAQATAGLGDPAYLAARDRARAAAGPNGIAAALAANHLDALIAPTEATAWAVEYARGDPATASAAGPPAVAGYPHLTVPMGLTGGLPVGLSFFAGPWEDARVLALGYAYENLRR